MNFKKGYFAFDIDGTLKNAKGELQPNVAKLFSRIIDEVNSPEIMFVSGGTEQGIIQFADQLKTEIGKDFAYSYASGAGAKVVDKDGNILVDDYLDYYKLVGIKKVIEKTDKSTFVCHCTDKGNFIASPKILSKDYAVLGMVRFVDDVKKITGFDLQVVDEPDILNKTLNNDVRSLQLITLKKDKKDKIERELREFLPTDYSVTEGFSTQINPNNKYLALQTIFGTNIDKVVYFGDGRNDILPLQNCKYSVALGEKIQVLEAGKVAMPAINDFVIDYAICGGFDRRKLLDNLDADVATATEWVNHHMWRGQADFGDGPLHTISCDCYNWKDAINNSNHSVIDITTRLLREAKEKKDNSVLGKLKNTLSNITLNR